MWRWITTIGVAATAAGLLLTPEIATGREPARMLLTGYLPDYRVAAYDLGRAEGLSDLIYFSLVPAADGSVAVSSEAEKHLRELRVASRKIGARLLVSLGGWGRSAGFAPLAADPAARARFGAELLALAQRFGVDGFDLDWEHPAGPEQNRHAGELATELSAVLKPRGLLLTAAVAEWQPLPRAFFAAVDRVHLMAYDAPDRHASLDYAKASVDRLIGRGVPAHKILLGVPFYARRIHPPRTALAWAELLSRFNPPDGADEVEGYGVDTESVQAAKVGLAAERGLAGIMVWELAQDTHGPRSLLANLLVQTGRKPHVPPVCPLP